MRLGIVSDIHRQWRALDAALERMGAIDGLLCLGDSIDQSRFCNDTVRRLRDRGAQVILGNHEHAFFGGSGRHASGVETELADWLASRPARLDLTLAGRRLTLAHATPWPSDYAYVAPNHRDFARFGEVDAEVVLYGHTHQPVVRRVGGVLVVNPGSLGEGRPDQRGFVRSFALLDLATLTAEIVDLD